MATIKYNYSNVQKCAYKVRSAADTIAEQMGKIDAIIAQVQTGWTGAGANEYLVFLQNIRKNISDRSQNLHTIADEMLYSASQAEQADIQASKALDTNTATSARHERDYCTPGRTVDNSIAARKRANGKAD